MNSYMRNTVDDLSSSVSHGRELCKHEVRAKCTRPSNTYAETLGQATHAVKTEKTKRTFGVD